MAFNYFAGLVCGERNAWHVQVLGLGGYPQRGLGGLGVGEEDGGHIASGLSDWFCFEP